MEVLSSKARIKFSVEDFIQIETQIVLFFSFFFHAI